MRKAYALLTVAPALLAFPALAQIGADGVAKVDLVGKVGVNGSAAVQGLTDPVGDTVDRVDGTVNGAVDATSLTLATREQVRAGAEIHDTGGNSIGTVQGIDGDTAIVVRGGKLYNVPLAGIYQGAVGKTHGLVTKLSSTEIEARTTAAVESR